MTTYIGKTTTIADSVGAIANVDAIGDLSLTADEIEDTVYGAGGWKTFVQGLKDAGTFDLTVNYNKDTSGNTRLTQAFVSGDSAQYTITFPDSSTLTFTAFVSGIGSLSPRTKKCSGRSPCGSTARLRPCSVRRPQHDPKRDPGDRRGELHPPLLRRDLDRDRAGVRDEDHRSPEDARRRPETSP